MNARRLGLLVSLLATALAAGSLAVWRWLHNWGAVDEEITRKLPGDELVPNVSNQSTMGVTIQAPPEQVWPWLAQMGVDRAGLYSYLFVENTLLRLGVQNADRIVPEWQDLKIGDHIWFTPEDYPTPQFGPVVTAIEPYHALVLCHGEPGKPCPGTWQFILERRGEGSTRLLLRERRSADEPLSSKIPNLIMVPGYWMMDRAMLRGIKERAEGHLETT